MNNTESDIFRAFNATNELRARSVLSILMAGTSNASRLTPEELIVQGCMVRSLLQQELSGIDYLTLKLYFTETDDIGSTLVQIAPIRQLIRSRSKIFGSVHYRFFDLCCLSELWGVNLFHNPMFRPMAKYLLDGQSPDLLTRRKRRISETLDEMKIYALEKADRVLGSRYKPE